MFDEIKYMFIAEMPCIEFVTMLPISNYFKVYLNYIVVKLGYSYRKKDRKKNIWKNQSPLTVVERMCQIAIIILSWGKIEISPKNWSVFKRCMEYLYTSPICCLYIISDWRMQIDFHGLSNCQKIFYTPTQISCHLIYKRTI